jgi:hypothetical protein
MELAIPIIALGGLYVISNQKNKKESFRMPGSHVHTDYVSLPRENKHFISPGADSNVEYKDLAGRTMKVNDQTENLVPYFGKTKNIGNNSKENDERDYTLDNYTGSGSLQQVKTERAPLFKPQDNIQHAYGMPNQTDFLQSRENPSANMHNVKPFQEERVAPGLNHGFTSKGSGGFNAGMEAQSQWLPKTVDQLRVLTNPKESFELANHQGPAIHNVTNLGSIGKVEKYLPDKYYVNTPDRYFTTTGAEQGGTLRSIQPNPTIHRATTSQSYAGVAGNAAGGEKQPQHGMYRVDHRQQLKTNHLNPATTTVDHSNLNAVTQSIELLPNNRTTMKPESFSIISGLVNAITAPITDILRPTRKENFGLSRVGALGSSIPQNTLPQSDKVASTMKESTTYSPYTKGQRAYQPVTLGAYQVTEEQPIANQRDTTSAYYSGIAGSTMPEQRSYGAEYNSTINSSRGNEDRIAIGNTQRFVPIINQTTNSTKSSIHTSYNGMPSAIVSVVPNADQFGTRAPQSYSNTDRFNPSLLDALKQNPYTHSITHNM